MTSTKTSGLARASIEKGFKATATRRPRTRSVHTRLNEFAKVHAFGPMQAKLTIGQANDRYEAEADRVADAVAGARDANLGAGATRAPGISRLGGRGRHRSEARNAADSVGLRGGVAQRQPAEEEEEEELQAKEYGGAVTASAGAEAVVGRVLRGSGEALPGGVREPLESRFGADFGGVRIHRGAPASEATRTLGARAFTVGRDIVFAAGQYQPRSHAGRRLLAHELTHVVQQGGAEAPSTSGAPAHRRGSPGSRRAVPAAAAGPVTGGGHGQPEEPFGEFNEEEMLPDTGSADSMVQRDTLPGQAAAPAAAAARTFIRGPRTLWFFNGATPPNYPVSARLGTNHAGGTFSWSASAHLALSSATDAAPTVTTAAASAAPGRDAWIRLRHTDPAGATTVASYRLTVRAPTSLTHLRNVDLADAGLGYRTEIHYSIHDQLGTILPRTVPINEQWSGPPVSDLPGENWVRPAEGSAAVNPTDWHDEVTGDVVATAIPRPVAPTSLLAALQIEHWPGDWRVGSLTIGGGRQVSSVTWQAHLGFARHT